MRILALCAEKPRTKPWIASLVGCTWETIHNRCNVLRALGLVTWRKRKSAAVVLTDAGRDVLRYGKITYPSA
jgi:hypothetical protein